MISQSKEKQNDYITIGNKLLINFNHEEKTKEENGETYTYWTCEQIKLKKMPSRDEIIEEIIKNKYPTYGSELAAINTGGSKYNEYLERRSLAYSIADTYVENELKGV